MVSKTYEEGYLDGLTHIQTEIERLRGEFDHALRIGEQTAQIMQDDRQKNATSSEDMMKTYQDGYLDGLLRSQAEIERLRGEFDHMYRIIEQTVRVMQQDREQFEAQTFEAQTVEFKAQPVEIEMEPQRQRLTG